VDSLTFSDKNFTLVDVTLHHVHRKENHPDNLFMHTGICMVSFARIGCTVYHSLAQLASCFVRKRIKDRFVIGLKVVTKHGDVSVCMPWKCE
jgi:hypothetical protein